MDKDTFDIAMKLNHGRTVREGDDVFIKEDDECIGWFRIISIFPKEQVIYIMKYVDVDTPEEYLEKIKCNGGNRRTIGFNNFIISFMGFDYARRK